MQESGVPKSVITRVNDQKKTIELVAPSESDLEIAKKAFNSMCVLANIAIPVTRKVLDAACDPNVLHVHLLPFYLLIIHN